VITCSTHTRRERHSMGVRALLSTSCAIQSTGEHRMAAQRTRDVDAD
jgi:hypothetical protein